MINFPDYMDIYLHMAIGLEPFRVVNIAGFTNIEMSVKESDRANNLYFNTDEPEELPEVATYLVPYDADAFIVSCSCPDDEIIDMRIDDVRKMQFRKWHKFKIPYRVEPGAIIRFTSDKDAYVNAQLILMKRGL